MYVCVFVCMHMRTYTCMYACVCLFVRVCAMMRALDAPGVLQKVTDANTHFGFPKPFSSSDSDLLKTLACSSKRGTAAFAEASPQP